METTNNIVNDGQGPLLATLNGKALFWPKCALGDRLVQIELLTDSMSPVYPTGSHLLCDEVKSTDLVPGKAYLFCLKTSTGITYRFGQFQHLSNEAIYVHVTNPAPSFFEQISLAALAEVYMPTWRIVKEE